MMHLSRASGQRGQETAICSGYASQGDTTKRIFCSRSVEIMEIDKELSRMFVKNLVA